MFAVLDIYSIDAMATERSSHQSRGKSMRRKEHTLRACGMEHELAQL